MAVNNDPNNNLYPAFGTPVKFFSSLTRDQAKGLTSFIYDGLLCTINDFPGAICYVSDNEGNSIFLNKLLFGDGANSGGSGGGSGGGGITEVSLDIIPVVELNGLILKTLADYFRSDGTVITDKLVITKEGTNGETIDVITLDEHGIKIGQNSVVTEQYVSTYFLTLRTSISEEIQSSEQSAKSYADSLISSVYVVKGTLLMYSDLLHISNPKVGWVYNVLQANGDIPAGTNYVYTEDGWDALGGSINLSNYKTSADTDYAISEALTEAKNYTDGIYVSLNNLISSNTTSINNAHSRIDGILLDITGINNAISTNTQNISQNTQNITNISTQLTWQ